MTEDEKAKALEAFNDAIRNSETGFITDTIAKTIRKALTPAPVAGDPAELQNKICGILSKYGVKEIYEAETEILHAMSQDATSQKAREWKNPEEIPPPKDGTRFLAYDRANNQTPFVAFCADGDAEFRDDADSAWIEIDPLDWCEIPPYEAAHKVIKIKGE